MTDIAKGQYEGRNFETALMEIGWYHRHTPGIVVSAMENGFSKSEIHRWTGLSRSTILRYQKQVVRKCKLKGYSC